MKSQKSTSKPSPPANLWEQMDAITGAPTDDDPGISVKEYAIRHKVSTSYAHRTLESLVFQGKLLDGWCRRQGGKRVKVYRPA